MALLQYDSISFAWPEADRRALDNVSLTIKEGAYTVLCGPSGCGKTTLLRQAKRELTPAGAREGTVYYRGRSIHDLTAEESASSIGFVQQNPDNQIVTDYVWHELAFGLENMGLPTQVIRRRVAEMASFFGIAPWYRKKTSELSGGQKQLLNLASTLAMNPGLLILDEPTSMLDPLAADNFLSMIQRVHSELGGRYPSDGTPSGEGAAGSHPGGGHGRRHDYDGRPSGRDRGAAYQYKREEPDVSGTAISGPDLRGTEEGGVRGTDGRSRESGAALKPSPSLKGR